MVDPSAIGRAPSVGHFRIGDVFSKSFDIFGRRFVPFCVLTVIAYIPTYVVEFLAQDTSAGRTADLSGRTWTLLAVSLLLAFICSFIAGGAVVYGVVQDLRSRSFSLGESVQIAIGRLLPMIGVAICVGFAVFFGFLLFIVPGLILLCMFYVSVPVCIVEQQGVFASMSRSAFLTKGNRWPVFGVVLLLYVISIIVGAVLGGISVFLPSIVGVFLVHAWQVIVGAFGAVISAVLYYELRVAKEGVDINQIASVFD